MCTFLNYNSTIFCFVGCVSVPISGVSDCFDNHNIKEFKVGQGAKRVIKCEWSTFVFNLNVGGGGG